MTGSGNGNPLSPSLSSFLPLYLFIYYVLLCIIYLFIMYIVHKVQNIRNTHIKHTTSVPSSLRTSFHTSPSLPPYVYLSLRTDDSISGFVHAAGFAVARRCLRFLVFIKLCRRVLRTWCG